MTCGEVGDWKRSSLSLQSASQKKQKCCLSFFPSQLSVAWVCNLVTRVGDSTVGTLGCSTQHTATVELNTGQKKVTGVPMATHMQCPLQPLTWLLCSPGALLCQVGQLKSWQSLRPAQSDCTRLEGECTPVSGTHQSNSKIMSIH